jgi:regulator of sigma E protease
MGVLIMIGQFILALSILVALHELGHMLPALWFGMKVEKYYIGFPPKVFSFVKNGIEYGLGAIPLGGFVKISGMVDESLDTKNLSKEPEPWEFRAKPAWQRLIVMLGGVIVNFVFGVLIVAFMLWIWGVSKVPISEIKNGIYPYEAAQELGFKPGDKITAINHKKILWYNEVVTPKNIIDGDAVYTVDRNGNTLDIKVPVETINKLSQETPFIIARTELYVTHVVENMGAVKAGIKIGDKILKIKDTTVTYLDEMRTMLSHNKNMTLPVKILRGKDSITVQVKVSEDGLIGAGLNNEKDFLPVKENYSFLKAFSEAPSHGFELINMNLKVFKLIFQGKVNPAKTVGGPVKMAQGFGNHFEVENFFALMATISIMLAFMNLLPIPALDGGHVMFLLYEIITRRKPSDKVVEVAQKAGMLLLFSLMILVTCKDIIEEIFKSFKL